MKKIFFSITVLFVLLLAVNAQNTSPFWSLAGNSNVAATSKLGATNGIPLRLFTNNIERLSIQTNGRVGIGTTTPVNIFTVKATAGTPAASWVTAGVPVFVGFAEAASSELYLAAASNTADFRPVFSGKRSRGTLAAPKVVANNDYITSFTAAAYDGSTFLSPAAIHFYVDGKPTGGHVPARISFETGTSRSDRLERLKILNNGDFDFNNGQVFLSQATGRLGVGLTSPNSLLHVNSLTGDDPFRVQVNGASKLFVSNGGGVSVGSSLTAPANGLFVSGNAGIGTTTPVVKLQVVGGTGAGPDGGGFIVSGASTGANIAIDDNEIMARSNGVASALFVNHNGGDLLINGTNASGNTGIGTTAPANRLHVHQAFANRAIEWQHESQADNWTVGIGTNTLNCRFEFNGVLRGQISSVDGSFIAGSDSKLKQDIEPIPGILDKVMQLKASKYFFKDSRQIAKHKSVGFIAQEVEGIFPELVYDMDGGYKGINYAAFAVVAIKAIQEQQNDIAAKDKQITELKSELDNLKNILINKGVISKGELNNTAGNSLSKASLSQSVPNPSRGTTILGYYLPNNVKKASIIISSINGAVLKSYPISQMGNGQLTINSNEFAAGTYIYTLTVDGNKFDSKKMVVLK